MGICSKCGSFLSEDQGVMLISCLHVFCEYVEEYYYECVDIFLCFINVACTNFCNQLVSCSTCAKSSVRRNYNGPHPYIKCEVANCTGKWTQSEISAARLQYEFEDNENENVAPVNNVANVLNASARSAEEVCRILLKHADLLKVPIKTIVG